MPDRDAPSLRSRALPIAVALALVSVASLLTDTVAAAQVVALAGPNALSAVYAISGLLLGLSTIVQFTSIDRRPRLTTLRMLGFGFGIASTSALAWAFIGGAPAFAISAVWIISDQVQLLLPVVLWSLAGDIFNTAESNRVYGWVLRLVYIGQLVGLLAATVAPLWMPAVGIPLVGILTMTPIACLAVALWLPVRMRHEPTSTGQPSSETLREAVCVALTFLREVSTWRALVIAAVVSAMAGLLALVGFTGAVESILGPDAGQLQIVIGGTTFAVLLLCVVFESTVADRIRERYDVPTLLLVLPIVTVGSAILLAVGAAWASIPILAMAMVILGVPTYTVDESARQAALTLVPDQLRARITFIIEFGRFTLAQVAAGLIALIGSTLGWFWLTGLIAAALAAAAIPWAVKVRRTWEESLLSWRLRRRKHLGVSGLDDWLQESETEGG